MSDKQLEELFRWHPWPGPDPALKIILEELDQSARQKVLVGMLDHYKEINTANTKCFSDINAANTKFVNIVHGAMSAGPLSAKKGGAGP